MNARYLITFFSIIFLLSGLCQAQEFELDEFLGTMAGEQKSLKSSAKNGEQTYSRTYKPFGPMKLREEISKAQLKDGFKKIGEEYSYTPRRLRDGRRFGFSPTTRQGGGFFLTLKELQDNEKHITGSQYALSTFGKQLEQISGLSMQEIQAQDWAYGIGSLIHQYFECTTRPEEGDLVVYPQGTSTTHAGIYRNSQPNWNSPYGGTVESKWGISSSFVFQHDVFFVPDHYGDVVQFYHLKNQPDSLVASKEGNFQPDSMSTLRDDLYFEFTKTDKNIKLREGIDKTFGRSLVSKIPAIRLLEYIEFIGVCYDYAFGAIFKTYTRPDFMPVLPGNDWIEKYFTVTTEPKKGDLVCYYKDYFLNHPVHYGIYDSPNLVESKWGQGPVFKHPPFYVGSLYGNFIRYYRLKAV